MNDTNIFVTVDGPETRDIDDAFSLTRTRDGLRLCVAIAQPGAHVEPDSELDLTARALTASIYARSSVVKSMLPRELSEQTCSLIANIDRQAMMIIIDFDGSFSVKSTTITFGNINVHRRLNYQDVARLSGRAGILGNMMQDAISFSKWLLAARRSAGALAFFDPSKLIYLDEEGLMREAPSVDEMVGHIVIQEFMVLVNTQIAKWAIEHEIPFLYRTHRAKLASPPIASLMEDMQTMGSTINGADALKEQLNVLMASAEYSAQATGHHALNLPYYAHVTSPLRRYPDLINQRQLMAFAGGKPFPHNQEDMVGIAQQINETIAANKEARSEGFKAVVVQRAARAMDSGQLARMGDPELVQAIKLAVSSGNMPKPLCTHLSERMASGALADKVLDALVTASTQIQLPSDLLGAWTRLLEVEPTKAKHFLMYAIQSDLASGHAVQETSSQGGFEVQVNLKRLSDSKQLSASGEATRKKDAENQASARLMCLFVGAQAFAQGALPEKVEAKQNTGATADTRRNYKGELLEWCQKHRTPTPSFEVTGSGPSNDMRFACRATLAVVGNLKVAFAENAKTKKEAEAAAAQQLLSKLI